MRRRRSELQPKEMGIFPLATVPFLCELSFRHGVLVMPFLKVLYETDSQDFDAGNRLYWNGNPRLLPSAFFPERPDARFGCHK